MHWSLSSQSCNSEVLVCQTKINREDEGEDTKDALLQGE